MDGVVIRTVPNRSAHAYSTVLVCTVRYRSWLRHSLHLVKRKSTNKLSSEPRRKAPVTFRNALAVPRSSTPLQRLAKSYHGAVSGPQYWYSTIAHRRLFLACGR